MAGVILESVAANVPDLTRARAALTRLGFQPRPGAERAKRGVDTALVRFGLDYLEVRAIAEPERARDSELDGPALVNFVEQRGGGLAGFALCSDDLAGMAERLDETSLRAFTHLRYDGPYTLTRTTPGGQRVSWRMLMPGGVAWRRPWPILVEWETPDSERCALEPPDQHPNTATGITRIALVVASLESARAIYRDQLGLDPARIDDVPALMADRATYHLAGCAIQLLSPRGAESPLEQILAASGEGPFELTIAVSDLDACQRTLARAGITLHANPDNPSEIALDASDGLGARLIFRAAAEPFAIAQDAGEQDADQGRARGAAQNPEQAPAARP